MGGSVGAALGVIAPVALIGTAAAAAPTYFQYQAVRQQQEAAKEQQRAQQAAQRRADIAAYRERIQAVRQARAQRGATLQSAQSQGVSASSGTAGAVSSIASQVGSNLSFLDTTQALAQQESIFRQRAVAAESKAATSAAYGQIAGSIFQAGGGYQRLFGG